MRQDRRRSHYRSHYQGQVQSCDPGRVRSRVRSRVRRRDRHPVRLTRRGRAVVFGLGGALAALLVTGAAVLVIGVLAPPASQAADPAPAGAAGAASQPRVAVVRPGDTLWSVAARHLPSRDAYGMIEEIRRLNDLPGHTIHPGQELILPDRP